MQNPIQKFGQSSIVFEKPGILFENLKTLTSSNYPTVQYFLLKLCTHFLLTNVYKRVCRIFCFCFFVQILSYLQKLNGPGFYTLVFYIFIYNSRSRQNLKNFEHTFVDIIKQKKCVKFQQKLLNSMVVGVRQSFQFFRQKTWFL